MSRINVSTKIYARTYTRGGPLNPTFANWILLRKGLAQKLGLRPKISAVRGITVTWRKIIEQVRKSNADEADRITAVLTREDKNIDLETKIHIRDGRLAGRNVWEILERQELREMIEAPPRKQPVRNCFCLGEIMDTAAPNQDLDKEQIQTLRYLLWYNVFEEPKNIIPLLKREDISLDLKTKLAAAYLRIQTPFDHYNQPEEVIKKAIPKLARDLEVLLQEVCPRNPQQQ